MYLRDFVATFAGLYLNNCRRPVFFTQTKRNNSKLKEIIRNMLLNIVEYHFQISCSFVLKETAYVQSQKKERRKNNQCSIFAAFIIFMNEVSRENEKK